MNLKKKKVKHLSCSPNYSTSIHPRELKTEVHTKACTQMFTEALLTTAKKWKQPKDPCLSTTDQRNVVYFHGPIAQL